MTVSFVVMYNNISDNGRAARALTIIAHPYKYDAPIDRPGRCTRNVLEHRTTLNR